jgi:hypothetical protein
LLESKYRTKAEAEAKGLNEFEQERVKIKENALGLSDKADAKEIYAAVDQRTTIS